MKLLVSDQTDADPLQIYRYVAERSPAAAESVAERINRTFENLVLFPFIGRDRSTLRAGLRSIIAYPYVIFYTIEHDQVVIVRVLHGRRDINAEFQR